MSEIITGLKNAFDLPTSNIDYRAQPQNFNPTTQYNIETGFFVFTMMPSLRCGLNCPHCYLSKEQRQNSPTLTLEQLEEIFLKVRDYYINKTLPEVYLAFYWYGGEPTQLGIDYMVKSFQLIEKIFPKEDKFFVKHILLTSLIDVDFTWFSFFKEWCGGYYQTSFDGLMRGKSYVRKWEEQVLMSRKFGLEVGTISVVNNSMIQDTPEAILDYLVRLNVTEASFLPMMLNVQNEGRQYDKHAPSMDKYSEFMIRLMRYWTYLKGEGVKVPEIGQTHYSLSRSQSGMLHNVASQTMFLMPNGDFSLPDYFDGYKEEMNVFGNILETDFHSIVDSKKRRDYVRKQVTVNRNKDCMNCEHKTKCIMEFWKPNREGDDCFGAKKFIDWLHTDQSQFILDIKNNPQITM